MQKIWIDGYNAAESIGLFSQLRKRRILSLGDLRSILLRKIAIANETNKGAVVVVFDGKRRKTYKRKKINVVFTSKNEEADDFLVRSVNNDGIVVTEDRELRKRLNSKGVVTMNPKKFFGNFNKRKKRTA